VYTVHIRDKQERCGMSEVVDYNYIINLNGIAVLPRQYKAFTVQWCWENEETSPSRPQRSVGPVIVKVLRSVILKDVKKSILLHNNPGFMYIHTNKRNKMQTVRQLRYTVHSSKIFFILMIGNFLRING